MRLAWFSSLACFIQLASCLRTEKRRELRLGKVQRCPGLFVRRQRCLGLLGCGRAPGKGRERSWALGPRRHAMEVEDASWLGVCLFFFVRTWQRVWAGNPLRTESGAGEGSKLPVLVCTTPTFQGCLSTERGRQVPLTSRGAAIRQFPRRVQKHQLGTYTAHADSEHKPTSLKPTSLTLREGPRNGQKAHRHIGGRPTKDIGLKSHGTILSI